MKLKSFAILSSLLGIFFVTSCNNTNNDPYKDKIVKESSQLTVEDNGFKKEYTSGSELNVSGLKVYFEGKEIYYFDSKEETIEKDKFFITTSDSMPTTNRIKKGNTLSTSKRTYVAKIYVGVINSTDDKVHLSKSISITLTNSQALNPVLYYVGTAVIFVAIGVLIYVTQKHKRT